MSKVVSDMKSLGKYNMGLSMLSEELGALEATRQLSRTVLSLMGQGENNTCPHHWMTSSGRVVSNH